jgi:predicted amidophosphoribosyltransferase
MPKMKIYSEPVKQQQVTHWDRDYLPTKFVDPQCPSCQASVSPGQPACTGCGEQLPVEHLAAFPRDAKAVASEIKCDDNAVESLTE